MIIKNLQKPKLKQTKMTCDDIIDPKLERWESVKCCWGKHNFTIVAGLMGSGKTSTLISLFNGGHDAPLKEVYHELYVVIPEISLTSIHPKDNIFEKYCDAEHMYHEYNADVLHELYDKMVENSAQGYSSCIIIDDFGSSFKGDKEAEKILNKMIIKIRHLKTSIFLLGQNIYQMPKKWREVATNLLCFNLGKSQMQKIFDEFYDYKKDQFEQIMKLYKSPHDFLLLNLKYKRLFYDWNEILFEDGEDKKPNVYNIDKYAEETKTKEKSTTK
jgi:hypothetical protein